MEPIENNYTNITKEQVMTWAARMPAYCFTELCPDPAMRKMGDLGKKYDMDEKIQSKNLL